jgi:hypothetical protein
MCGGWEFWCDYSKRSCLKSGDVVKVRTLKSCILHSESICGAIPKSNDLRNPQEECKDVHSRAPKFTSVSVSDRLCSGYLFLASVVRKVWKQRFKNQ